MQSYYCHLHSKWDFGEVWAECSSSCNFSRCLIENKETPVTLSNTYPIDGCATFLEKPILALALKSCLTKVKGKTPDLDRSSYDMIKILSVPSKRKLIDLYNSIVSTANISHPLKLAVIFPIPKNKKFSVASHYRWIFSPSIWRKLWLPKYLGFLSLKI